jgi:DNA-directed RNA polymerase subunit RPC12/RpoP
MRERAMEDGIALLAQHGYKLEDAVNWAKDKYPDFINNKSLIAKLFLASKGISIVRQRREIKKIAELEVGQVATIRAALVAEIDRRSYIACPICYKRVQGVPGEEVECQKDGKVKAVTAWWILILAGDDSGEIILTFPPSITKSQSIPPMGHIILARGALNENNEFMIYSFEEANISQPVNQPISQPISQAVNQPKEEPPFEAKVELVKQKLKEEAKGTEGAKFICSICGKEFENGRKLAGHRMQHSRWEKAKEVKEVKETQAQIAPLISKPEPQKEQAKEAVKEEITKVQMPQMPQLTEREEELRKYARMAAYAAKPYDEFVRFFQIRFPNEDPDEALALANCEVREGRIFLKEDKGEG